MTVKKNSLIARLKRQPKNELPSPARAPAKGVSTPHNIRMSDHDDLTIFIVAGEHSGDVLGAAVMSELASRRKGQIRFIGVGGEAMEAEGLTSLFPLSDIAVMGPVAIFKALPRLTNRVYRTVAAGVAAKPDLIVIIDSPEFTHRVAKRLRRKLPHTPIIDYVCPSVWAWRPGRAKKMARYIDHVLTLLPFEPAALKRLSGPPATYVGHPLSAQQAWIQAIETETWAARLNLNPSRIPLVILPGSRRSEVESLMPIFGEVITALHAQGYRCDLLMPSVPHLRARIEELSSAWPMPRHFIEGTEAKFAAFRLARAALAASGTVTLELGIAGTPMVVCYLVDGIAARLRFLLKVQSVVLANLVLERNAFPELLQEDCNATQLSDALKDLIEETPARAAQLQALKELAVKMAPGSASASSRSADVILSYAAENRDHIKKPLQR